MGVAAALSLAACSNVPKYVALDPANKAAIQSIDVHQILPQDEIYVTAANPGVSAAMGGGLIGALIDSQISKSRQAGIQSVVEPFYASVDDVDLRETFWSTVEPQVRQSFAGQIQTVQTSPSINDFSGRKKAVEQLTTGQGLLFIYTRYTFTPDYSRLVTSTMVDLWKAGGTEPVFSNIYTYQSKAIPSASGLSAWSAEQGRLYREAVKEGSREVSAMLALDVVTTPGGQGASSAPTLTLDASGGALTPFMGLPPFPVKVSGTPLDARPQRAVLRDAEGRLWSLSR